MQGASITYSSSATVGASRAFYKPVGFGRVASKVCLGFHGLSGTYKDPANFETPEGYLRIAAQDGRICCTADWGGDTTWGNDAVAGTGGYVDTTLSVLNAMGAYTTDKIWLYSGSMGAAAACNWAVRNLSKVAALVLIQPAVNLSYIHDVTEPSIGTTYINQSYGGNGASSTGWNAAKATHDPMLFASSFNGVIPTKVWYSTGDGTIRPADPPAFAALAGSDVQIMPGAPPHGTIPDFTTEILPFLRAHPG